MSEKRLVDLAREVVAQVRPEELGDFDRIADVYARDPRAIERSRRARDEPTASGVSSVADFFSTVVMDVGVDLLTGMVTASAVAGAKKGMSWVSRKRAKPSADLQTVLPAISSADAVRLVADAHAAALRRGASAEDAALLSAALADAWTRT